MNPEEDEDAFLYGDSLEQSTAMGQPATSAPKATDQEMEQASEGEVEDDEEGEEESDSVYIRY
jgi:hypothetical protein